MQKSDIIKKTADFVKKALEKEGSGHDLYHVERVWKNAKHIAKNERSDLFVVELAALLHDIADWKLHKGDDALGPKKSRQWLESLNIDEEVIEHVCGIIKDMSFKGAGVKSEMKTLEGKIVQDADRLDAIGAIGIARTFTYGGFKGQPIYLPETKPTLHASKEEYVKGSAHTINHFYEKLLLLKDLMNTETAKKIAQERHEFMEEFLEQFFKEWNCEY